LLDRLKGTISESDIKDTA